MKRLLSILFALSVFSASCQKIIGIKTTHPTGTEIGQFINETFAGSSLSSNWSASGTPPTITVSGSKVRLQGSRSTKDAVQHIKMISNSLTSNGYSLLREYVIEGTFKINATGTNDYGALIGVKSNVSTGFNTSLWGLVNFKDDKLEIYGADGSDQFQVYLAQATLTPTINTTDNYLIRLTVTSASGSLYIKNTTTNEEQSISGNFGWTVSTNNPVRPNIFRYSFGVAGDSDISFDTYTVSSTQHYNPVNLFVGNSITTGYMKNAGLGFPEVLDTHTSDLTEIAAGGGMKGADIVDALDEIISRHPERVFLMSGTNDAGDFATGWTNLQAIVSGLNDANIDVYILLIVNGGNPLTAGQFNYNIKTTYPTKYIDTWTTGWNTMSIGNGEMADALHPTASGFIKLANIIKSTKPAFFPL